MTSWRAALVCAAVLGVLAGAALAGPPATLVPMDLSGNGTGRIENVEVPLQAPRAGEFAPDFELPSMDGRTVTRLSSFRGARPVVLVFGSYT